MKKIKIFLFSLLIILLAAEGTLHAQNTYITSAVKSKALKELSLKETKDIARAEKAIERVAEFWKEEDGSPDDFISFCKSYYIVGDTTPTFLRIAKNLDAINGHTSEISRILSEPLQLDINPVLPIDRQFGEYAPMAHFTDDMFKTKIAFNILLNFPEYTLSEKNTGWKDRTRLEWAKIRLGDMFNSRIPSDVVQEINKAYVDADSYISSYNIYMHNIVTPDGKRLFPEDMKLISHWGLRDELRSQYKNKDGLLKQKTIQKIMERIITQEIPSEMINNNKYDWEPFSNKLFQNNKELPFSKENNVRYKVLKSIFKAAQKADRYNTDSPTLIDRTFNRDMEISEKDVEALLLSVISSPQIKQCAGLMEQKLGRKLTPFDLWYTGFEAKSDLPESELNKIVARKYPSAEAFQKDIPNILIKLGFEKEKAHFLASRIMVDPARGAGHAMPPGSKEFNAHLRTRMDNGKMNYKSYNIAMHELGHCVEQVYSNILIDNNMLSGVPNTAFTEAFAFLFQSRDLEVLGVKGETSVSGKDPALETLWKIYEIGGVSLTAMKTWRWMYSHPDATEEELKTAVINIARELWNKYYEPIMGQKDCTLLAVYSHMIDNDLYLPNYPIGYIIRYQIEAQIKGKNLASEMSRMCLLGRITPDAWMQTATGSKISTHSLLENSEKILKKELK